MQDFAPFTQSFWGPGKYLAHTYKNIAFIYSVRNKKMMYDKTTGL
jgi:hypothetical protein